MIFGFYFFFLLARFVKYSNIKADMAFLMEHKVVRYENLRFFSMSAVCLLSADCLLFAILADMDSTMQYKVVRHENFTHFDETSCLFTFSCLFTLIPNTALLSDRA